MKGLVSMAWSFAKASHLDIPLMAALARAVRRRVGELHRHWVVNLAL